MVSFERDRAIGVKLAFSRCSKLALNRCSVPILAFLVPDAETRVFCYANGELRKDQQNDEILHFVRFWKERTGWYPEELIFDSKLTTYAKLNELNRLGIQFITLAALPGAGAGDRPDASVCMATDRVEGGLAAVHDSADSRSADHSVRLRRSCASGDRHRLGHEEPTILLTNQLTRTASKLVGRYAQRMIIENSIADGIDFFHIDALSSAVAMKVNCDLKLTLMASSPTGCWPAVSVGATSTPSRGICSETSWMPRPKWRSRSRLLWCGIRSVLITPCSSRLALIRRTWRFPGWGGSGCNWCSDSTLSVV